MNPVSTAPQKTSSQTKTKFKIGVVTPITSANNSEMTCLALDGMCSLGFTVSVLAEGDSKGQDACFKCAENYPKKFSVLESIGENKSKIISESDVVVFPVAPSKDELNQVVKLGAVPVLPEGCGLDNFDQKKETGGAFTFQSGNIWSLMAAVVRASENRKFSWDWKTIKQNLVEASY